MITELITKFESESSLLRRTLLAAYATQEIIERCGDVKLPCVVHRSWVTWPAPMLAALFDEQPAGFGGALLWKLAHEVDMRTVYLKALAQRLAQEPEERHEALAQDYRLRNATCAPISLPDEYAAGWVAYRLGKGPGRGHLRAQGWLASREDFIEDSADYAESCRSKGGIHA